MNKEIKNQILDTIKVYIVWVFPYDESCRKFDSPEFICKNRATAVRLGERKKAPGQEVEIREGFAFKLKSNWYAPVKLINPSTQDLQDEAANMRRIEKTKLKHEILTKAKTLGLTDEEIEVLK